MCEPISIAKTGAVKTKSRDKRTNETLGLRVALVRLRLRLCIQFDFVRGQAGRSCSLGESARVRGPGHKAYNTGLGGKIDIGLNDAGYALKGLLGVVHARGTI